ncbi:MAG: imidazole glycerol phosphate synthase subunit HisH [Actinomycetota bacterium]
MTTVAVLDYGMGNLHSVSRALAKVGATVEVTGDAELGARADALVVPGVGHFGACMRALARHGLEDVVRRVASSGAPVLGVCLGMQVLFERSEEDDADGLGVLSGGSRKLPDDVKVPHMGWNDVTWIAPHPYVAQLAPGTRFYFVHSYAPDVIDGLTVGTAEYGRAFSAVVARDNVFATQFHPEKSGDAGLQLYETFVKEAGAK